MEGMVRANRGQDRRDSVGEGAGGDDYVRPPPTTTTTTTTHSHTTVLKSLFATYTNTYWLVEVGAAGTRREKKLLQAKTQIQDNLPCQQTLFTSITT
ncbi:hypothetical protein E2C01_061868 [Portunus trituberculatus]|uniref:Uncharacterized protein n=1 Tax=Portunus trituberculatus TaxID=210409 RepID=A0A5B7HD16_PORTR|nr:hypothetical protein [Portunus trituberculatus]